MRLAYSELENDIRLIKLNGQLDMNGTYNVEVQFVSFCNGENVRVIVDLEEVTYLSSVGIPMLVNTAKSVKNRGGKFILLRPQENVAKVLNLVGISQHIPIHDDLNAAVNALQ